MRRAVLLCAIFVSATAHAAIPGRERAALLAVYNATGGPNWQSKDGWGGPPGTECNWAAVTCDDAGTTVTQLVLGYNNLRGTIPKEIGDLTNLERLNFSSDRLSGTIPAEIGTLLKLEILQLDQNELSGTIPPLGALTNLVDLELEVNKLTGPIPAEIGRLTKLKQLSLYVNQLSGSIPREIGQLTALEKLELDDNTFNGSFPAEIGNLTELTQLTFAQNSLSGNLPAEITQLRKLQVLVGFDNEFTGPIPDQIGNLSQLTDLEFYGNQLSGAIPQSLFTIGTLETVGLARNRLVGTIDGFARLSKLVELHLDGNAFSGAIPAQITSLQNLEVLVLDGNQLTGPIPADIDRLTHLRYLDLGQNRIGGTIPVAIGNLPVLEYLGLYEDELTGPIPPQIAADTKLQYIDIHLNSLTGTIPDSFRALKDLVELYVSSNPLSGTVPDWLPELPKLQLFLAHSNGLTGTLPANITSITDLYYLDVGGNNLTGPLPPDIGRLQRLAYLTLEDNEFTGPIPDSFWTLTELVDLRSGGLHLSGTLPAAIRNLTKLANFDLHDNDLFGTLPPEIGALTELRYLDVGGNRLSGTLPRELGNLKKLEGVSFAANNFRAPIPPEITRMGVVDGAADFDYNALSTTEPAIVAYLNRVQYNKDFTLTQTVTPASIRVTSTTDRSAVVEWTPITYQYDEGGYRVFASLTQGGAPAVIATTSSKEINSITVRGLQPSTTYFFSVAAVTHPHDFQRNLILSDVSSSVSASTAPRQLAPADVVLTATPAGLVQLDGVPQNEDSFTLTNFGDVATNITFELNDNDFYEISPATFVLGAGASQTVKLTSIPKQPAGVRYGSIVPRGDGTSDDDIVTPTLLSVTRAGGNAIAEATTSRVEVSGDPGSDSVGQVSFRNKGTARLTGILVADVPWLVPNNDPITIDPGSTVLVRFKVVRSRRPGGVADGALTGTLSLIYVGALPETDAHIADTAPPAGISITKVTVVDTSKPDVNNANAPQLAANEIAYFIAGLTSSNNASSAVASDLRIINAFASRPANDVRLYYSSSTLNAVANLTSLAASQAVTLANITANVYGATNQTGSLQVRSASWQNLVVNATLLRLVNGAGTFAGDLPVFRSDRALRVNEKSYLTGIRQSLSVHATVYLEEIAGTAADILVAFVDSNGAFATTEVRLPAYARFEVTDVPASTATIVVTNAASASPSRVLAYARMSDEASGDTWSIADWSRQFAYARSEAVRVPLVQGGGSGGGKRRAVVHDTTPRASTSITLYNPGATDSRAAFTANGVSKEVTVPARQTVTIADAGTFMNAASSQSLVIEPQRGELAITSRTSTLTATGGSIGSAVPIVSARSGLRVGQGQIFAGLEDSSAYRTDYGFAETSGAKTTIRATLLLSDARSLFTTVISRDFALDSNGFILVTDLVKSILGSLRSQYGDLHDLQLQLEVTEGAGSILPFVVTTDRASGDSSLRLE